MTTDVTGFIARDRAADRVPLPGGLVPPPTADGPGTASVRWASARGSWSPGGTSSRSVTSTRPKLSVRW